MEKKVGVDLLKVVILIMMLVVQILKGKRTVYVQEFNEGKYFDDLKKHKNKSDTLIIPSHNRIPVIQSTCNTIYL